MTVDLEALGALVPEVPGEVPAATAAPDAHGRLAELARWWAAVSPDVGAAPSSVRHLWGYGGPAVSSVLTAAFGAEPFLVPASVGEALEWGLAAANAAADDAVSLLVVSVPSAPVLTLGAHLLGVSPVEAQGWPAAQDLTDAEWIARVGSARDGLRRIRELAWPTSAQVLEAIGSPELAAGTAVLLQASARATPCLLDGPGATVCALLARTIARRSTGWFQAASDSGGRVQTDALSSLKLRPVTSLGVSAEDGTAGVLALGVLTTAVALAAGRSPAEIPSVPPPVVLDLREDLLTVTLSDDAPSTAPPPPVGQEEDGAPAEEPSADSGTGPAGGVEDPSEGGVADEEGGPATPVRDREDD